MAAPQQPRTRATANSSRPLQPRAPAPAPAEVGVPGAPSPVAAGKSSLSVFLTNLRLLDLDLLPDWPAISPQTFAASGAAGQGQKRRIQCVEWALFRLFALYNPQETANKLQPFFPPLDQMQSLNLRAALLRALEAVKKNGALGRDCVVRKTMLDECKGERFEEVLALFSTAVLKALVARGSNCARRHSAVATSLVLEDKGHQADNAKLVALTLAHRTSLCRLLERKELARARYRNFADLLNTRERAIAERTDILHARGKDSGGEALSDDARAEMRRTVRTNWVGDEQWMETLLGGSDGGKDPLLAMPFDRVWRRVQQGRLAELENEGGGLLDQLDSRVRAQKERLQRWQVFRDDYCRHHPESQPAASRAPQEMQSPKGLDLDFAQHQDLQTREMASRARGMGQKRRPLTREYADLVNGLQDELSRIRRPSNTPKGLLATHRAHRPEAEGHDSESEISDLEDEAGDDLATKPSDDTTATTRALSGRATDARGADDTATMSSGLLKGNIDAAQLHDHDMHVLDPVGRKHLWEASPSPTRSPRRPLIRQAESRSSEPWTDARRAQSPTQELADRILENLDNQSPSPNKRTKPRHTLSLAQRTRLSMARADNLFLEDDEPDPILDSPSIGRAVAKPRPAGGGAAPAGDDEAEDLVSRTQRSMAGFEKARQKAQLERRRSQRKSRASPRKESSLFPAVDEETARDSTMLAEELMGEEDMEAVFRSRPKIKASPIPSPTREWADASYE